jgi:beta-N-acetylhexosaminidase
MPGEPSGPDRTATSPPTGVPSSTSPSTASASRTPEAVAKQLPWGPTEADIAAARGAVAAMPLEQVAGQVIVASYSGTNPSMAASLVRDLHLAGVILMGDNVAGPEQVRSTAAAVQRAVADDGRSWPAVVTVDQEGGLVARVRAPAAEFPTFMTAGAAVAGGDVAAVQDAAEASGAQLRSLGFTWVNAPDADVTIGPSDPTIGSRSASDDPKLVARTVTAAVEGYLSAGIVPVAKHYPGHGSVTTDSHVGLPVQKATIEQLRRRDLVPFTAAARAGVPAVMMSHVAVSALDPGVPSTLAAPAYRLLRQQTGFTGVVVTDALDMQAVTQKYGSGGAAVRALEAGADLLLMPADVRVAHAAVVDAVQDGQLDRERLDDAAARVVALMRHQAARDKDAVDAGSPGPGEKASAALSAAGITVVSGTCSGPLVKGPVRVVGGTQADRDRFRAAARERGLSVSASSGEVVRLLPSATASGSGDVVVALDAPYGLGRSSGTAARIALYGRTPQAFVALVDVLMGKASAPGRLPVAVSGMPARAGCR